MKQLIITCALLTITSLAQAQTTAGKVYYTATHKLNIDLKNVKMQGDGMSSDQLSALIPKESNEQKVLYFNPEASLFTTYKTENHDINKVDGDMQLMIHMAGNDSKTYRDIKNNKLIDQQEFMSRKFLITSDIAKTEWRMTGEQKQVLGYPCQQATMMKDTTLITAWFTAAIPVSTGPLNYGGLPGMILEMTVGKDLAFVATKVEDTAPEDKMMNKPKEGKKVTKEEFDEIVKAKTKEMQAQFGGGGNIIIKTEIH